MQNHYPATVAEALKLGYRETDQKYERGYISRRDWSRESSPLHLAKGNRRGELYYYAPAYNTTRYCVRVYLVK